MEPPSTATPRPLVGVFIGGRSSRMGFPKGLARFDGERVIDRVVRVAAGLGRPVLVGRDPGYGIALPRIEDAPHLEGPLAGLLSLLEAAGEGDAVALSCDLPYLDAPSVARLAEPLGALDARLARRSASSPLEPFFARYAAPRVRAAALGFTGSSPRRLVATLAHASFVPVDVRALDDWDDPESVLAGGGELGERR